MTDADIVEIIKATFFVLLKIAGPVLVASLVMGVSIAALQTVIQLNESALVLIPKLMVICVLIFLFGSNYYNALSDLENMAIGYIMRSGDF